MPRTLVLALLVGSATLSTARAAEADPAAFRPYAAELLDRLALGAERLESRVEAGDREGAKQSWIAARVGWERGETFLGEYFPESDEASATPGSRAS